MITELSRPRFVNAVHPTRARRLPLGRLRQPVTGALTGETITFTPLPAPHREAFSEANAISIGSATSNLLQSATKLHPSQQYELARSIFSLVPRYHGRWIVQGSVGRTAGKLVDAANADPRPVFSSPQAARQAAEVFVSKVTALGDRELQQLAELAVLDTRPEQGLVTPGVNRSLQGLRVMTALKLCEEKHLSHASASENYRRGVVLFAMLPYLAACPAEQSIIRTGARHFVIDASNIAFHRTLAGLFKNIV